MRINVRAALATLKTGAARFLNASGCFSTLRGRRFDGPRIDIVADTMDHTIQIASCKRLSITLQMIISLFCR